MHQKIANSKRQTGKTKSQFTISSLRLVSRGEVNILMVMIVFFTFTTLVLAGLSIYYIRQYQTAKTTVEVQKTDAAEAAKTEQQQADEVDFAERVKMPYRTYTAPTVLGALTISFPKTWNLYAEEDQTASAQISLWFNPEIVRADKNYEGAYSLRATLEQKLYTEIVKSHQKDIEEGKLLAEPIKVKGIKGTRYTGLVSGKLTGIMVILPIRDKTLSLWTESTDYTKDFNSIINRLVVSP